MEVETTLRWHEDGEGGIRKEQVITNSEILDKRSGVEGELGDV